MRLLHLHYRLCFHPYMILSLSDWTVLHIFSPLPVTLSQAQAVLEKFAGTVLEWGNGVAFG